MLSPMSSAWDRVDRCTRHSPSVPTRRRRRRRRRASTTAADRRARLAAVWLAVDEQSVASRVMSEHCRRDVDRRHVLVVEAGTSRTALEVANVAERCVAPRLGEARQARRAGQKLLHHALLDRLLLGDQPLKRRDQVVGVARARPRSRRCSASAGSEIDERSQARSMICGDRSRRVARRVCRLKLSDSSDVAAETRVSESSA